MDNGRNGGKFSEGGRMGFEPVENVGLAAKESAQEILKIFNQVHEPRVVHSSLTVRITQHAPSGLSVLILSVSGVHGWWVLAAYPSPAQICLPAPPLALRRTAVCQHGCVITTVSTVQAVSLLQNLLYNQQALDGRRSLKFLPETAFVWNYTDSDSPYSFPPCVSACGAEARKSGYSCSC